MIRIRTTKNPAAVVAYFLGGRGLMPEERRGVWFGRACDALGIQEGAPVTAREFALMLDGYDASGRGFLQRWRPDRRVAYDMVVSPAKAISVAALCWREGGAVIRDCFAAAARGLVGVAERLAKRQGSCDKRWATESVAAATFIHDASRYGDPHLHAHLVMGNVTWDGNFWALGAEGMYRNHMTLDGIFQRDLAWRLSRAGLKAELKGGVAVLPVAEEVCRRLSRGRNAIEETADRLGVTGTRRKALEQVLNDRLRPRKRSVSDRGFERMLSAAELRALARVKGVSELPQQPWERIELWKWMRHGIRERGFETERNRWDVALRAGWRDVGRSIHEFLDVALDGGLMIAGAEREGRARARRARALEGHVVAVQQSEAVERGVRV